jgi:predicted oxidoreductase
MNCPRQQLSPQGPEFSRIVAGMWRIGDWGMSAQQRLRFIEQCIEQGVTTFDHADIYGNYTAEAMFGAALKLAAPLRERMEIVGKCGIKLISENRPGHALKHYDTGAAHIAASVDESLKNLGTDYLDLLLIHRPDPLMDFDEIAQAFTDLRRAGKVRHFGVSNFSRHQFDCLNRRIPLVTNQVEFSPLCLAPMQDQVFDGLQDMAIRPMIWSPLAGGQLFKDGAPALRRLKTVIAGLAGELDTPFASVVYAWIMQLPSRPLPLTGSGRIEAVAEAVRATSVTLSRQQWFAILEAATGHEVA